MFKRIICSAIIFGAAALAPPVTAQSGGCMPRDVLVTSLTSRYSESLAGAGLQTEKRLIELWRSVNTGTFTIFLTRPDGISCVLATGRHWFTANPEPESASR